MVITRNFCVSTFTWVIGPYLFYIIICFKLLQKISQHVERIVKKRNFSCLYVGQSYWPLLYFCERCPVAGPSVSTGSVKLVILEIDRNMHKKKIAGACIFHVQNMWKQTYCDMISEFYWFFFYSLYIFYLNFNFRVIRRDLK